MAMSLVIMCIILSQPFARQLLLQGHSNSEVTSWLQLLVVLTTEAVYCIHIIKALGYRRPSPRSHHMTLLVTFL